MCGATVGAGCTVGLELLVLVVVEDGFIVDVLEVDIVGADEVVLLGKVGFDVVDVVLTGDDVVDGLSVV